MPRYNEEALRELEAEAKALAKSRKIQTEEGRAIVNLITRLIELQLYGEPRTPAASDSSHHS